MITIDQEGKVYLKAVDFILRRARHYAILPGINGSFLRQMIFMDWLQINRNRGPELREAYNWLESNSVITPHKFTDSELLGE